MKKSKKIILLLAIVLVVAILLGLKGCQQKENHSKTEKYTISFNMNNHGIQINPIVNLEKNATIVKPTDPIETGYTFTGWYKEQSCINAWDFNSDVVTQDTTLYANWTMNNYKVTINVNEQDYGKTNESSLEVPYNTTVVVLDNTVTIGDVTITATPALTTGQYTYAFSGWSTIPTLISEDTVICANFTRKTNKYTVTWKNDNGKVLEIDTNLEYGTTPKYNGETPSKAADARGSYTFKGWDKKVSAVRNNVVYTATYDITYNQFNVTFDVQSYGIAPLAQTINYGSKVVKPTNPTETGYTFNGWYKEQECINAWDFDSDVVTSDLTLYAKWTINQYSVVFKDGDSVLSTITQDYGTAIIAPSDPTKDGYTFTNWDKAIPATMPAENTIISAVWSEHTATLTYYNNGHGTAPAAVTLKYSEEAVAASAITDASDYTFIKWNTKEDGSGDDYEAGSLIKLANVEPIDLELYAQWQGPTCLARGTMITMADGSRKAVETLNEGDIIRTFNHDTGKISTAKIMDYWQYEEPKMGLMTLHFTNDINVNIVSAHAFYNKEENKYVILDANSIDNYLGKHFYNADNDSWEELESVTYFDEKVDTFFIASEDQFDCVVEGMLSVEDGMYFVIRNAFDFNKNLKVNKVKKFIDILRYGLFKSSDFEYVTSQAFVKYKAAYLKVALGKGIITEEFLDMLKNESVTYESNNIVEEYVPENVQHSAK